MSPTQNYRFISPPGFLLRRSELCLCGGKEGGGQFGRSPEFCLERGGLPFRRRYVVRAQAIVRSLFLVSSARSERGWLLPPHRCPQLKSIGVGFGALLPGVRSHVCLSPHWLRPLRPT